MSRSQPDLTNPAQHFLKWSGSKGTLAWWNKDLKVEVPVKLPFKFLVLDELATITGYSDQDSSGYWSNEVRSVAREELHVKTAKGTKQVGLYKDLADVRSKGAKYAKSVYIAHKVGDDYVIGNIKVSGAALTSWIELSGAHKVQNGKVTLTGSTEGTKGATTFKIPTFEYDHADDEENAVAIKLDRELQIYLSQYFAATQPNHVEAAEDGELDYNLIDEQTVYNNMAEHEAKQEAPAWENGKIDAKDIDIDGAPLELPAGW